MAPNDDEELRENLLPGPEPKFRTSIQQKRKPCRTVLVILFIIVGISVVLTYSESLFLVASQTRTLIDQHLDQDNTPSYEADDFPSSNADKQVACNFPRLKPFDKAILKYYSRPSPLDCGNSSHPHLFMSDRNALKMVQDVSALNFSDCQWCPLVYLAGSVKLNEPTCWLNAFPYHMKPLCSRALKDKCKPITNATTIVPSEYEFAYVLCKERYKTQKVGVYQFINEKPQVVKRIQAFEDSMNEPDGNVDALETDKLNVVIIGIDAMSHMNFQRQFRYSVSYLTKTLSAYSMLGYTKVGDNTFPNIVPVLTGLTVEELTEKCWKTKSAYFDSCPFIWKNFSSSGYRTAYGEDETWMGIFNYGKKGFKEPPADYYFFPVTNLYDSYKLTHKKQTNAHLCYGGQLGFELMMDSVERMAVAMNQTNPYFHFLWATSLTHDSINVAGLGDDVLLHTLQRLNDENYLNNTALIVMSDHGIRWGSIRNTMQGKLEERMPFLYFVLPTWFREKYRLAVSNMRVNMNRLTTPFDLHETIASFLDTRSLDGKKVKEQQVEIDLSTNLPRGISLFQKVPGRRTCADAAIDDHWCVCRELIPLDPKGNALVAEAAKKVVVYINSLFKKMPQCKLLTLTKVINAQVYGSQNKDVGDNSVSIKSVDDERLQTQQITLALTVEVAPSKGIFETTLTREVDGSWSNPEDISRINLYGNQSRCVTDYNLKPFCYC